jgi:hypothetical protein
MSVGAAVEVGGEAAAGTEPAASCSMAGSSWRRAANLACSSRNWRCDGLREKVRGEEKADEAEGERWAREGGNEKEGKEEVGGRAAGGIITAVGELVGTDRSFSRCSAPKLKERLSCTSTVASELVYELQCVLIFQPLVKIVVFFY